MIFTARLIPAMVLGFVVWQAAAVAAVPASPSSSISPSSFAISSRLLVGAWNGIVVRKLKPPVSIDLVLLPNGSFGERSKYEGMKRMRFGRYQVVRGKVLHFKVAHFEPDRACTRAGCEPISIEYEVKSISATKLVLQEKGRAAINFARVRQTPIPNRVSI
jgi:hypothetical protein